MCGVGGRESRDQKSTVLDAGWMQEQVGEERQVLRIED